MGGGGGYTIWKGGGGREGALWEKGRGRGCTVWEDIKDLLSLFLEFPSLNLT